MQAKPLLDLVAKRLNPHQGGTALAKPLNDQRDATFTALASIIRATRNEAGHPVGNTSIDRDYCFDLYTTYRHYRRWVGDAIASL